MAAKKSEWHDWVGELFEPTFGAKIEDLLGQNEEKKKEPKVRHVSVHDTEAVKQVYEKVRLMTIMDEEMRRQRTTKEHKQQEADETKVEDKTLSRLLQETMKDTDEGQKASKVEQSCIWDSEEISVLRKAFKSVNEQNKDAMVQARLTAQRNKELETLVAKQQKVIDAQREKLEKTKNANRRLKFNVDSLNDEVKYLTAKVSAMEEVFGELNIEKADMLEEVHENRVAMDKERMERERIEIKLATVKQEALAEKLSAEETAKNRYRQAIFDLEQTVKKLEKELEEERNKRRVTEKGLKHLRTHFSSLPVQDIVPSNIVERDEVSRVQF